MNTGKIAKQLNHLIFSLLLSGFKKCKPDWYKPLREQPRFSLWVITKGSGEVTIDGTNHKLKAGKVVFFNQVCFVKKRHLHQTRLSFILFVLHMQWLMKKKKGGILTHIKT
ncbi:AraC family ligand binding domain-containing protein [Bacillus sp. REN16]|uniref:AraC family ligand binding domain-containing protein n=1 Tax=Bacillus sp. REN16 TaxID=2887296 RepID=UPI001E4B9A88|nr:AraC family ligand binding domain-containing protein [Bacillus sp. REN16]MCC3357129.1 AraC family ligand binding domain-containing protein [Bacillus sp. REN16]